MFSSRRPPEIRWNVAAFCAASVGEIEFGPERDEELESLRLAEQRRGDEPRVLAPRAGRGEHAGEAEVVGRPGDLGEVVDRRRPPVAVGPEGDDGAAVTGCGEEPVQYDTHR